MKLLGSEDGEGVRALALKANVLGSNDRFPLRSTRNRNEHVACSSGEIKCDLDAVPASHSTFVCSTNRMYPELYSDLLVPC